MKGSSKVRYGFVAVAMTLFGTLAACSGANVDETGNATSDNTETSDNAESVNAGSVSSELSGVQTPSVRKCGPYQVCCEPLPGGACNLCRSDYRYCP